MKVFLAIGNKEMEEELRSGGFFEVIDSEDNLASLFDLMDFIEIDGIVVNRLLDSDGRQLSKIIKKAAGKGIKVIVLVNDMKEYNERKLITVLVNGGATAFIQFNELSAEKVADTFENYPAEFDFGLISESRIEYRETIKSVFREVIAVYSPLSEGASCIAAHLATALAEAGSYRVCLVDYNPLQPRVREIFNAGDDYSLTDALDAVVKGNLTSERLEHIAMPSRYRKNLDLIIGIYDLNEYYASTIEQYEEIIKKLKFVYDYVIIDTHSWHDVLSTDAALRLADHVIVPVIGTEGSIDSVNRYLSTFDRYRDFDVRKFKAVINQYGSRDLTSLEISAKLKLSVAGYISEHKAMRRDSCFRVSKVMNEFVPVLHCLEIDAKKKRSLPELFKRKRGVELAGSGQNQP